MLIARADAGDGRGELALRTAGERIVAIAPALRPLAGETVFDAAGAAVLPGLHDHHLHLLALAAALASVPCGPPQHGDAGTLAAALRAAAPADGWIRGVGYHASVAGDIDRDWLDAVGAAAPVRVQHRSGQLWVFDSCALARLGLRDGPGDDPFERRDGRLTGRLYGGDDWLRARLGGALPDLQAASLALARRGVTGVTDASPGNGRREFEHLAAQQASGRLRQRVLVMGGEALAGVAARPGLQVGPTKLYLREAALPTFDDLCAAIARSHAAGRAVAVHCVTPSELVFAVEALRASGVRPGDRIEHASLCPDALLALLRETGLRVVTQPNFVFERGDAYLAELPAAEIGELYRARGFVDAGIALAAGTDAPHGEPDPWRAMAAAVRRRSRAGVALAPDEALAPAQALALFMGDPLRPGDGAPPLAVGAAADLCVIDRSRRALDADFAAVEVRLALRAGEPIWPA